MSVYENLGYPAKEIVPESFAWRASGVARDLVGNCKWQEGVCAASRDIEMEGKAEGSVWTARSACCWNEHSRISTSQPTGEERGDGTHVDRPRVQIVILRSKRCQCDV